MKIEGAIFDLDGTLLDSMPIWDTIGADYLKARGVEPRPDLYDRLRSMSLRQAAGYYQTDYGLQDSVDAIMNGVNAMVAHFYAKEAPPKDGALEFLGELRRRGVRMCVATATDKSLAEAALKRTGMLGYFSGIFTCTAVGHGKDEPDIYEAALRFLGTPKLNTWVFEDALYAANTAKVAGFPVVGVYDRSEKQTARMRELADLFISPFSEMRDHLG